MLFVGLMTAAAAVLVVGLVVAGSRTAAAFVLCRVCVFGCSVSSF